MAVDRILTGVGAQDIEAFLRLLQKHFGTYFTVDYLPQKTMHAASTRTKEITDMPPTITWYPFVDYPEADSCWSLSTGPDGRVYAAACCEGLPGGIAKISRYNRETDRLDFLLDMGEATDDLPESRRATQCKIHYSFAPSPEDDILYMATHLSGPPIDLPRYSPWHFWNDPVHCFRGAALVAYDTKREETLWWDTIFPKEGCRCMLHDPDRRRLYALSYPRDHLWVYDLKKRTSRDLGRIGSVNAQALFLDGRGRVWTSSDDGRLVRYDPETDRLTRSPYILPHDERNQTGWHSVLYDAVAHPVEPCVYGVTWIAGPRLFRLWTDEGEWGRLEDLGQATQERDLSVPMDTFTDHAGGLVFARDGMLYYTASRWTNPNARWDMPAESGAGRKNTRQLEGVLRRLDHETLEREDVGVFERPEGISNYMSRGAIDSEGDLFFGMVNHSQKPNGVFRVELPRERKQGRVDVPLRMWG